MAFFILYLFLLLSGWVGTSVLVQAQGVPIPQSIEIAANIYEYRLENEKQLGVFYQFNSESGTLKDSDLFLPGTENIADSPIRALDLSGSFAKLSYGSIDFNIKTAILEGRATILSNPTLMVAEGEQSNLVSGIEYPVTVLTVEGNRTKLKTEYRPTGITMTVTPYVFRKNYVLMDLEIESSEITRFDIFDRGDGERYELPVVSKRNIKTVVLIPSGQQLYIGGLYTNNTGDLVRKVPILGDLPGLGFFLRGFNKKVRRTETVFQITPTIKPPGIGIETEDTIFQSLLQTEGNTSLINRQQVLNEANKPSPFDPLIPGPGPDEAMPEGTAAGEILTATEAAELDVMPNVPATAGEAPQETPPVQELDNNRKKTINIFKPPRRYQ